MADVLEITTENTLFELEQIVNESETLIEIGVNVADYGIVSPDSPVIAGTGSGWLNNRVTFVDSEGNQDVLSKLVVEQFEDGSYTIWIDDGK